MALDPTTGQPIDPYQWPPPEWQQPGPLDLASTLGPRGTGSTIDPVPPPPPPPPPLPGELSKYQYIGPTLAESSGEVPRSPLALPDVDPMSDPDPRLDATPDELAAKPATPPQLGEFPPMQVGQGAGDIHPFSIGGQVQKAASDYSKLPEAQQDEVQINQAIQQFGAGNRPVYDSETGELLNPSKDQVRQGYLALKQQDQQRKDTAKLIQDDMQREQEAHATFQKAQIQAQQDLAEIDAQAKKIGQVDPNHYASTLGTGQKVLGILAAITGGLTASAPYGNGQNVGLDMLNKAVERDVEAQKYNINARIQQLGMARNSVAERLNLAAEAYKSEEIHRQALYQSAVSKLQTDAQNFDQGGSTVARIGGFIQQIGARATASMIDAHTKLAKLRLEEANARKAEAEAAKLERPPADAGSATNPNYTVATGLFDPFTKQPIFAKDKIKDLGEVKGAIDSYRKVDEQYAKLQAIARRVNGHYQAGSQVWKRFQSTDEAEYNQTRSALLMSILHARGERPNKDALEAQGVLVPDLTKILGNADTIKMLDDSQADNDRDIAGYLNLSGVNGDQIIANAQRHRKPPPEPNLDDSITAANEAVQTAKTPAEKRDALAAVDAAQKKAAQAAAEAAQRKAAVGIAAKAVPMPRPTVADAAPPDIKAITSSMADAVDTYNQAVVAFHTLQTRKQPATQKELEDAAIKVTSAQQAIQELDAHDAPQISHIPGDVNVIDTTFHAQ